MTPPVSSPPKPKRCPCGSGAAYADCCGVLHEGRSVGEPTAPTAERLMRSRFSAFALRDADYLLATWDPRTSPRSIELEPEVEWQRLEIIETQRGGPDDDEGVVEFVATFWDDLERKHGQLRERSAFRRRRGQWFYVDAER
ncbi:MAG: YchJ family metal-binding protein [Solirubrobacteraceae bacterium]|nr:YchJ family metal-binding protein [Solirubrobacteraceae bacterium]